MLALPYVRHPDPFVLEAPTSDSVKAKEVLEAVPKFLEDDQDIVALACPGRAHGGPYGVDAVTIRAEAAKTTNPRKPRYLLIPRPKDGP